MFKFRIAATALLISGAVVPMVAAATPASAADYCPSNHVCMWEDSNFTGDRWVDQELGPIGSTYDIDGWDGDNEISSIFNGATSPSGKYIRVWGNDDLTGGSYCVQPNGAAGNLGGFDNDAESFEVVASC